MTGFTRDAFAWFEGLERDNSRPYFTATRATYEAEVREPFTALLEALREDFGPEYRVFRQHRDVRFSADKSPYKTRTYGVLGDPSGGGASRYAELSARGLYAGTGLHGMARDQLGRYRDAVADDTLGPELEAAVAAVEDAGLELAGASLRTAPRGVSREHPRIGLLRRTALFAGARLPPGPEGIRERDALAHLAGTWRAAAPLAAWLDVHVGPSTLAPEGRYGARSAR